MITYLWVALGGALGTLARFAVSRLFAQLVGETFPWGTLVVNVTGSFVIGLLAAATGPDSRLVVSPDLRQFLLVGICGGYTTFSSFSVQTLNLLRDGELAMAGVNVGLSVLVCMVAVWLGAVAGAALNQVRGA